MDTTPHRILQHLIDGPDGTGGMMLALGVQDLSIQGDELFLYCGDAYLSVRVRQSGKDEYYFCNPNRFFIIVTRYQDGVMGGLQVNLPLGGELTSKTHNIFRDIVIKLLDKDPYLF
jgi:hypothetical protein